MGIIYTMENVQTILWSLAFIKMISQDGIWNVIVTVMFVLNLLEIVWPALMDLSQLQTADVLHL